MSDRKTRRFEIEVCRRYYVTDTFIIESDSEEGAKELAEELSGDKDYTGKLQLEDVDVDIYSEEVIDE